ncbi:uncharacterized protein M421DRAFT_335689 [Didymella exigua CBS 183.55]|uniref:MFS general substrate transporter n=1 Tax=Didymella exigua CBS 183.55 TaxID=1150837 RepID=A0A6A5R4F0_9PLEO|nr:uncharacterized protein M421DRAFT_335689 [Didymella exigua CBS 183.55]KAF1922975.1 hypothetical protein M421DRAFT_335689 [Didymella exigua CBS 183.55]
MLTSSSHRTASNAMRSHPSGTLDHAHTETPHARHAAAPADSLVKPSRDRAHTYAAHALNLFNVYGIPLTSGIWLEYYFTSSRPSISLLAVSSVFGTQLACLGLATSTTLRLHHRPKYWRVYMLIGTLFVCGAHLGLLVTSDLWVLVLCQGALTGLGLGMLGAVSLRVLSTHYKHNVAVTSTLCGSAGFFGAIVHSTLTWICLRTDNPGLAHGLALSLLTLTLFPALLLARPGDYKSLQPRQPNRDALPSTSSWRVYPVSPAMLLTTTALLIPPLHLPLLLTRHPGPNRADAGLYTLLTLYGTAVLTSAFVPRIPPRRLSSSTLCGVAGVVAGAATVPLVWMQSLGVAVPCAAVYGAALGCVAVLWVTVFSRCVEAFRAGGVGGLVDVCGLVAGLSAAGGVVGAAALLQGLESGVEVLLGVVVGGLVLGGLGMGGRDFVRRWKRL